MRLRILPYKMGSEGAKALSVALDVRQIFNDARSRFIGRQSDVIINWGLSVIPQHVSRSVILNHPNSVSRATNKLRAYESMSNVGVPVPEFTTSRETALRWVNEECRTVYARKLLSASCGRGIDVCVQGSTVPNAPLYTVGFKAKREYRVHVCRNNYRHEDFSVIDFCKKGKRAGRDSDPCNLVRNHENGWIFIRSSNGQPLELPEEAADAAVKAVRALGLDFGAVDIGWRDGQVCVYEVNSAPGFSIGSTPQVKYAEALRRLIGTIN